MRLEEFINKAIDKLIEKDKYLLDNDVNERAITHKLAEHMQHIVGELLDVDCEYNRNINNNNLNDIIKRIPNNSNKEDIKNIIEEIQNLIDKENYSGIVNPDIIVHKRGECKYNTIIVEAKKSDNLDTSKKLDDLKLRLYTLDENLNYSYGVYIEFFSNEELEEVDHKSGTLNDLKEIYIKEIRYYKNGDVNDDCKDDSIFEIKKLGK